MYSFLLLLFCIALSKAHPKAAYEKLSSTLPFTTVNESINEPGYLDSKNRTHESSSESMQAIHHLQENVAMQNLQRPRFLMTYENIYKPNEPLLGRTDPFQNILLYFLMNFGREIAQSSIEENKLHRPTEFFNNPRNKIDDPNKALNREMLDDEQNEQVHFFPHVGGTCMCFNRRQNRDQEIKAKAEDNAPQEEANEQNYCQRLNTVTTELKTENHNVPSSNNTKKSTVAVHGASEGSNNNNTIIKVVRLAGHNKTSDLEVTTKLTTAKNDTTKEEIVITGEEIVVDLQLTPEEDKVNKHMKPKIEKSIINSPIKIATSENDTIQHNITNTDKSKHDESYYFLSSSGGTGQRTTASNKLASYMSDMNTIHVEDKQKHLQDSKKRKRRVRRHLRKIEKYLHKNFKRHPIEELHRNEESETKDIKYKKSELLALRPENDYNEDSDQLAEQKNVPNAKGKNMMILAKTEDEFGKMNDVNDNTHLKTIAEIMRQHNWPAFEQKRKPQRRPSDRSTVMPTLLGVGTFLLIIGYILKTKGWFYNCLSNKSHLVSTEVSTDAKNPNT